MPTVDEGRFPVEAWIELFPGIPYPVQLSDAMVRCIASVQVLFNDVPGELTKYLANKGEYGELGLPWLNLTQAHLRRLREMLDEELAQRTTTQKESSQ